MKDSIKIVFEIPEAVSNGLKAGEFIRRGGVIQDKTGKVILWLKEGKKAASEGSKLVKYTANLSKLGKATLAATEFLYMHENFKEIKEQLSNINAKLDAQNISKVKSGFQLCIEAEKMKDKDSAKTQIVAGRQLLEEGSNIFYSLYENDRLKNYEHLKMFLTAELAIIKTYFWVDENIIANTRMSRLKETILEDISMRIVDKYMKKYVKETMAKLSIPFINMFSKNPSIDQLIMGMSRPEKRERVINKILEIEGNDYLISDTTKELLLFKDSLDGYLIELNQPKETMEKLMMSEY